MIVRCLSFVHSYEKQSIAKSADWSVSLNEKNICHVTIWPVKTSVFNQCILPKLPLNKRTFIM